LRDFIKSKKTRKDKKGEQLVSKLTQKNASQLALDLTSEPTVEATGEEEKRLKSAIETWQQKYF
jgi:hypothetical protein